MKQVVVILLCALLLCGCQKGTLNGQDSQNETQPGESGAVISRTTQSETAADTNTSSPESNMTEESDTDGGENVQKLLGGLTPEEALEYMKTTENLVIVEVNTAEWKKKVGFIGAMWIPHDEMAERYDEIPENCPVLLYCGAGVVSVPAYETLQEKRPDIPELGYIAGAPMISEYNEWIEEQK